MVINGPNLNLLGKREPNVYGIQTLKDLNNRLLQVASQLGIEVSFYQSNHEGDIIDQLHQSAEEQLIGIILNPGAFTHYSYAIRDAIAGIDLPVIEVHISNVHARESFRRQSVIAPVSLGQVAGFGFYGYEMAMHALLAHQRGEDNHDKNR